MKARYLPALMLLAAAPLCADAKKMELGGKEAGCPMTVSYAPDFFRADPAGALAFARPLIPDLLEAESFFGAGSFRSPADGREWYVYGSLGMSCDPYFLFLSTGPSGKTEFIVNGERLDLAGPEKLTVSQRFNLHFGIERRLGWPGGRLAEVKPDHYAVKQKTRALKPLPLHLERDAPAKGVIGRDTRLTVVGYHIDGRFPQALVKLPDGRQVWIYLGRGLLDGVEYKGD